MDDMNSANICGAYQEHVINLYEGGQRKVFVTEVEVPFPEGKLIVSCADKTGAITHANKAFIEMSGYEEAELIGQPHAILRHPDMPRAAFKDLWDTLQAGKKWHGYVKNLRKDGAYYWVYATIVANVRKGELVGYTSVRRKPSRKKIEECIALYKELKNAEV